MVNSELLKSQALPNEVIYRVARSETQILTHTYTYISTLAIILIQTSKSYVLFTILVTNETTYMIK